MNASPSQPSACHATCSPTCTSGLPSPHSQHTSAAQILDLFRRHAAPGICYTDRYRLPFYVWGSGPPLIFVHGVSDVAQSFAFLMYLLKDRFRCIAYDLPNGHNDGARLGRYRHAHLVDDLRALLDHLDLQQAFILGSSFGSTIALSAMRQMPERFPRGIVQGGFARRPLSLAERLLAWTIRFIPGPMAKFRPREKMLSRLHKPPFEAGPADRWRAFIDWTAQSRVSAVSYQIGMVHQVDLREQLAQIQQPILLVHGELDPVMPRPHAEMLLAGLPNATLAVIENCGHVPCYSHPEILANLICRFLAKPCPSPQECPGQRVSLPTT